MCRSRSMIGLSAVLATGLLLEPPLRGQDDPPAAAAAAEEAQTPSEAIVIPDEPRTIDPSRFVPEPLAKPVTVEFQEATLREVVDWLREDQMIAVRLDERTLRSAGVLASDPVSDRLDDAPLYLLLDRLGSAKVDWYFDAGVLHLTTIAAVSERMTTEPYNVGSLLDAGYDGDSIIHTIQEVTSGRWFDIDGTGGTVQVIGDVMFVRQTDRIHRETLGLLQALAEPARMTFVLDPPQNIPLREKLDAVISVDLENVPLIDAIASIADTADADLRLDLPALRSQRIHEREPVTLVLPERDLRTVLDVLLADLNLTAYVQHGVILVAPSREGEQVYKTAAFNVSDLCRDDQESLALLDAVQNQTSGPWFDLDGRGGKIEDPKAGVLVIQHSEAVLREVLTLLEAYRTALRVSKPRDDSGDLRKEVIARYYKMHEQMAADLITLLPQLVAPESWRREGSPDAPGNIIQVASQPNGTDPQSVLIVTQSRENHEQIAEVIQRISQGDAIEAEFPGGNMGGGGFGGGFFSTRPAADGDTPSSVRVLAPDSETESTDSP